MSIIEGISLPLYKPETTRYYSSEIVSRGIMLKTRPQFKLTHVPQYSALMFRCLKTPILVYFALAGNIVTFGSALLFYNLEKGANEKINTYLDAVWWAFCTVSTVGYGDITPTTIEGRLTGAFLMVTGILFFVGFTAILVSLISSAYAHEILEDTEQQTLHDLAPLYRELKALRRDLHELKSQKN